MRDGGRETPRSIPADKSAQSACSDDIAPPHPPTTPVPAPRSAPAAPPPRPSAATPPAAHPLPPCSRYRAAYWPPPICSRRRPLNALPRNQPCYMCCLMPNCVSPVCCPACPACLPALRARAPRRGPQRASGPAAAAVPAPARPLRCRGRRSEQRAAAPQAKASVFGRELQHRKQRRQSLAEWQRKCKERQCVLSLTTAQSSLASIVPSHRRDCHFAGTPSPFLLKHFLTGEGMPAR